QLQRLRARQIIRHTKQGEQKQRDFQRFQRLPAGGVGAPQRTGAEKQQGGDETQPQRIAPADLPQQRQRADQRRQQNAEIEGGAQRVFVPGDEEGGDKQPPADQQRPLLAQDRLARCGWG